MAQLLISIAKIPGLSSGARRALVGLISFRNCRTGQCNPGIAELSKRVQAPEKSVYRWLAELRAKGVAVGRRRRFAGEVWWEFPSLSIPAKNENPYLPKMAAIPAKNEKKPPPPPLYEQTNRTEEQASRLAGLLSQIWPHLPGAPGAPLLARVAEALGDTPLEHFAQVLAERQAEVFSFGLALNLAAEARQRWTAGGRATPLRRPPGRQASVIERTEAMWAERIADGRNPLTGLKEKAQ